MATLQIIRQATIFINKVNIYGESKLAAIQTSLFSTKTNKDGQIIIKHRPRLSKRQYEEIIDPNEQYAIFAGWGKSGNCESVSDVYEKFNQSEEVISFNL